MIGFVSEVLERGDLGQQTSVGETKGRKSKRMIFDVINCILHSLPVIAGSWRPPVMAKPNTHYPLNHIE
jgi:hypothetical protein